MKRCHATEQSRSSLRNARVDETSWVREHLKIELEEAHRNVH